MFATLQNTVAIDFKLVPDGPILVRAQTVGLEPGAADMEFQRTVSNGRSTVFLAGSGLKGALRAHCERIIRSTGSPPRFACDPTKTSRRVLRRDEKLPCGLRKEDSLTLDYPHYGHCPACFTFGSMKLAGRFRLADAYPADELWDETNRTEVRTGVGIDRKSQGAQGGVLYDSEVVVSGGFAARMSGENFCLWQLGLVLTALQDLDEGMLRIGGNKARGMGAGRVSDPRVELRVLNDRRGFLTGGEDRGNGESYFGLTRSDNLAIDAELAQEGSHGLFRAVCYEGEAVWRLAETLAAGPLLSYLERRG